MFRRWLIRLNNLVTRWRRVQVRPENLLLLLPHCLHLDSCPQNIMHRLDDCRRCGRCSIAALLKARDAYGLVCCVVGGGQQALAQTKRQEVKAIVAVACDRELTQGILFSFPKPVLAVTNSTPEGPCHNTTVNVEKVIEAIDSLMIAREE